MDSPTFRSKFDQFPIEMWCVAKSRYSLLFTSALLIQNSFWKKTSSAMQRKKWTEWIYGAFLSHTSAIVPLCHHDFLSWHSPCIFQPPRRTLWIDLVQFLRYLSSSEQRLAVVHFRLECPLECLHHDLKLLFSNSFVFFPSACIRFFSSIARRSLSLQRALKIETIPAIVCLFVEKIFENETCS